MLQQTNLVCLTGADGCGAPFPNTIDRQDRGTFERAGKKRTRGMALMMIDEQQASIFGRGNPRSYHPSMIELVLQPGRNRIAKTDESMWCERQIGFEQPFE